jgi:pentatricopeptide repeat protein
MENKEIKPTVVRHGSLINCLCKDGRLLEAQIQLRDMIGKGVLPNAQIYDMLMDSSSTMGNLKDAFGFFDEMVKQAVGFFDYYR